MAKDPEILAHQEWLGYVQPVGLVVSIPALCQAQCYVNKNIAADHQRFLDCLPADEDADLIIKDFPAFTQKVLGWEPADLIGAAGADPIPDSLRVALAAYGEILEPTYAVRDPNPKDAAQPWMLLISVLPVKQPFDKDIAEDDRQWKTTPQARFERLLRETHVPAGLLFNGTHLRLVYAPRGENSGNLTFSVADMAKVAGRPIFAALHMLLCAERLFTYPDKQRLPTILIESRKYQNTVSTQLAEQVLAALYDLLRGFQAADNHRHGDLLRDVLAEDPNHVFNGLLTVLMRLVFILYAEDRGLLSTDPVFANFYSITGLFERLRADDGRHHDTMDRRYGAWAQFLTLFRLIYDGGSHGALKIPARRGYLFDPERYRFLEGRRHNQHREPGQFVDVPHVSDGVIFRVLSNLLILDGERLSYRTLDVEQIGSVYEVMMGFGLGIAEGPTIAIKPKKPLGAPVPINLDALLAVAGGERAKWFKANTDQDLTGEAATAIKTATTVADALAALERRIAHYATPAPIPKGGMVAIPSDERRRSGSNYTPRSLTEPIVRKTLEPILHRLGKDPTPQQILDLKICDPAVGSGAFLVEGCRQLGDELVKAWHTHKQLPKLPPDEDEVLHARRLIAQRCLYGVDRNPMAADLAKLSLWLATLAKDHPFTFLDHSIRCGDSLVGLTRKQISEFHWKPDKQMTIGQQYIQDRIRDATAHRKRILDSDDALPFEIKQAELNQADGSLDGVRFFGDLVIAAFFGAEKEKQRTETRNVLLARLSEYLRTMNLMLRPTDALKAIGTGPRGIKPFHWAIEFPEVFERANGGFDSIIGNPPFLGGKRISTANGDAYRDWLASVHTDGSSNADLVAHFFRRSFGLLRMAGTFGLIATNTISQGDTRATGLRWICVNGGCIYSATKRFKWPGSAAVVVSIVHVEKQEPAAARSAMTGTNPTFELDGRSVGLITAFLFHAGTSEEPSRLASNKHRSYHGGIVLGSGFLFDDRDADATPLETMREIIRADVSLSKYVRPYIGGEELNQSPSHHYHRFAIDFGDIPEAEARKAGPLLDIVERKVRPFRSTLKRDVYRNIWWLHGERQPAL